MPSANEAHTSVIEEKLIMFLHFFPNSKNANMHVSQVLGANAKQSFIPSTNPTREKKKGTIES